MRAPRSGRGRTEAHDSSDRGHQYCFLPNAQVKFNPGRSDNMIIQSIALLDQLDKDLNTFAMRVREWCVSPPPCYSVTRVGD
jgi:hypothetical protein